MGTLETEVIEMVSIYYIMGIITLAMLEFVVLVLAKDAIKLKWQAMLKKKKNYLYVTRLGSDLKRYEKVAPYEKGMVDMGGARYKVYQDHIYFSPTYNIPSVVVSDKLASSLDPTSEKQAAADPTTIDDAVMAAVMGKEYLLIKKWLQILTVAIGIAVIGLLACGVTMFMVVNGAQEAGITLTF